jgi:predicted O-methyltransferase YrrM
MAVRMEPARTSIETDVQEAEVRALRARVAQLESELALYRTWQVPGHFYSPIPDREAVARRADRIFRHDEPRLDGIDLGLDEQVAFGERMMAAYRDDYFPKHATPGRRYHWRNEYFPFADAFYLDRFLRDQRPKRVVEIGSGFSSAVMLDTADDLAAAGEPRPRLDFVEPYTERLEALLREGDTREHCRLWQQEVQDVPLSLFDELESGDLLLIDSSHVAKTGSDVVHLFFRVLPRLARGVFVFVHDVPWPLEYPRVWVDEGRAWNEAYILKAFLMYNREFAVRWLPGLIVAMHLDRVRERAPLLVEEGATGMWMQRV